MDSYPLLVSEINKTCEGGKGGDKYNISIIKILQSTVNRNTCMFNVILSYMCQPGIELQFFGLYFNEITPVD